MFLFESIRVDNGQIPLLNFHQKRVDISYSSVFKKVNTYNLQECIKPFLKKDGIQKCRFIYDDKKYRIEIIDYQIIEPKRIGWLRIDPNFNYSFKYYDRNFFNKIKESYSGFNEIILVKNDLITDSTYCNLIVYAKGKWIVPQTCLLNGVERTRIISAYNFPIEPITIDEFLSAKEYKLINAMRPFEDVEARKPYETIYLGTFFL
jgi:4-amino-4-deoxychorismate lyase